MHVHDTHDHKWKIEWQANSDGSEQGGVLFMPLLFVYLPGHFGLRLCDQQHVIEGLE